MMQNIPWKQWLLRVVGVLAAITICWLLWRIAATHGSHVFHIVRDDPPPGAEIVVSEPPLSDDDAFATLGTIAIPIHKSFSDTWRAAECDTKNPKVTGCKAILESHLGKLKAFDAWVASNKRYGLDRPPDLGRHTRVPVVADAYSNDSRVASFMAIGRLLEARIVKKLSVGDTLGAERDLRTLFALADFVEQNPSLVELMAGILIQNKGLGTIIQHWPTARLSAGFETMLPLREHMVEGLRMAIGEEWRRFQHTIQSQVSPRASFTTFVLGLYDEDDTLRLASKTYRIGLDLIETSAWGQETGPLEECDPFRLSEGLSLRYIVQPNTMGRMTVCMAYPNWYHYANRAAHMSDATEATRVVLAARRYRQENSAWPTQETELVPKYLKAWPVSLRSGQPLAWLDQRQGVQLTGWPCGDSTARAVCEFHFSPPQAMAKEATERR